MTLFKIKFSVLTIYRCVQFCIKHFIELSCRCLWTFTLVAFSLNVQERVPPKIFALFGGFKAFL